MLEGGFLATADLRFEIERLLACRLRFDCTPGGQLFGIPVNGQRVRFAENVFYEFEDERIAGVWSVIDKAAVAAQVQVASPSS